ncbi:MAG: hypothetical protein FWG79_04515 [Bacteroidales bacterium]|nr:hypothetical protein [Bacteroidales bacterium]
MKAKKNNLMKLTLCLLMMQGMVHVQAQIRVGGTTTPNQNAILDLNANDTIIGTKGLLLPRVMLESTTISSPLATHIQGMLVYNTVTINDVFPGIYYNNGTSWERTSEGADHVAKNLISRFEIIIDEPISTQSVAISGESDTIFNNPNVLNIEPIFSDDEMAQTYFFGVYTAGPIDDGTRIKWRLKISNANFDASKINKLEKLIISYECDSEDHDHEVILNSSKRVQLLVGQ